MDLFFSQVWIKTQLCGSCSRPKVDGLYDLHHTRYFTAPLHRHMLQLWRLLVCQLQKKNSRWGNMWTQQENYQDSEHRISPCFLHLIRMEVVWLILNQWWQWKKFTLMWRLTDRNLCEENAKLRSLMATQRFSLKDDTCIRKTHLTSDQLIKAIIVDYVMVNKEILCCLSKTATTSFQN